jgi:zinc protease
MLVMKDSFESGMRMLSDMARKPAFAQAEIDRKKQQTLSGLQVSVQDPEYVANSVFDRLVYGFHPYGMPDSGTPETLAAVRRDDLVAFHSKYFAPNNAILAIVGDVTAEEAFTTAKKVFGDWEKKELPSDKYIDPPDPHTASHRHQQTRCGADEVRVGHLGITRSHPDYLAVNLAIRILGGEGSNRLHQVLRTERGLTYGAQANMAALKVSGDFEAETNTRSEATGEVLRLIVDEFWRLQRERVGERELADAKAYMTGQFSVDDRDSRFDRDAGVERDLLRPAVVRTADVPGTRQRGHGRRHPARRARVSASRPAVGRAGRQRQGVRLAARRRWLRHLRKRSSSTISI